MKGKAFIAMLLPLLYLGGTSSKATTAGSLTYQMYVDPVVRNQMVNFHFDLYNKGSLTYKFDIYQLSIRLGTSGTGDAAVGFYQSDDSTFPFTLKPKCHLKINKSFASSCLGSGKWNLYFELQGTANGSDSMGFYMNFTMPHGPGKAYYKQTAPFTWGGSDVEFAPNRTSYDLCETDKNLIPHTPIYRFQNGRNNANQIMNPFNLSIKKIRLENGASEFPSISQAKLTIYSHNDIYEGIADEVASDGGSCSFNLTSATNDSETKLVLRNSAVVNKNSASMRKGKATEYDEVNSRVLVLPLNAKRENNVYHYVLDFLLDGHDWIRLDGIQENEHYGLCSGRGKYVIEMGE